MARTIEEIVSGVELADVKGLQNVDVEDVYQQMDHMMQARPSPMELYNRWEKQQWRSRISTSRWTRSTGKA